VPEPTPAWRGDWRLLERHGPPATLVATPPDPAGRRLACLAHPSGGAVVLGSAQASAEFDADRCARAGLELVKRRSGGGAVVVLPGAQVWLDLFVPVSDQLFDTDVVRASSFVGALWRDALVAATGTSAGLAVHASGLVETAWSRRICFSGIGPGELTRGGQKVTGLAQRRDRTGAWFFTMALVRPEQHRLASLLAVEAGEAVVIETSLEAETAVAGCPAAELERALAAGLGGVWSPGEDVPAEPHPGERED